VSELVSAVSTDTISYTVPSIFGFGSVGDDATAPLPPTSGNGDLVLQGSNFGPSSTTGIVISATYGATGTEFVASSCEVTTDHTRIKCTSAAGEGKDLVWIVSVDG
jgi:hypothetical protein